MTFRLSPEVTLGKSAPTATFAFLGTRGSGKTYGAGVFAEELLDQNVQVVVIDPVGPWYALRLDKSGHGGGYAIPVFGGIHGDVPLTHTAGAMVASLIVERRMSAVLDVSDFTDAQQHRFVTDLCREVFQLKKRNKSPLHFIFDEAHEFFPQFVDAAAAPMVGATKRLWKVGRNYGIGGTLISPRAAEVNKGVLNLTDEIYTGKLKAPEDIKRIDSWANANGVSDEFIKRLPDLPKGRLIAWRETGAVETRFREKKTFDASRTPDGTEVKPQKLAPINLDEIRSALAEAVTEVEQNDPVRLRKRIVELERQLAAKPAASAEPKIVYAVPQGLYDLTKQAVDVVQAARAASDTLNRALASAEKSVEQVTARVRTFETEKARTNHTSPPTTWVTILAQKPKRLTTAGDEARLGELSRCARSLLKALAQLREPTTDARISAISGYRVTSSGFVNALSELRTRGLMTGEKGARQITGEGWKVVGDVPVLPTGLQLLDFWLRNGLGACERKLLAVTFDEGEITRDALAKQSGYSLTSSGFVNALSTLRTLQLIDAPRGSETIKIAESFR